jgi:hypothetical protein
VERGQGLRLYCSTSPKRASQLNPWLVDMERPAKSRRYGFIEDVVCSFSCSSLSWCGELEEPGVEAVHSGAALDGDERRGDDPAVDTELRELPVQGVSGGAGLVAVLLQQADAEPDISHCLEMSRYVHGARAERYLPC